MPTRTRGIPRSGRRPPRGRVRAIVFDFGGTLVRPLGSMLPVFRAAARRIGARVPWSRFLGANDACWAELWPRASELVGRVPSFADRVHERVLRRVGCGGDLSDLVQAIREEALSPRWHPPFPEVRDVLDRLASRGYSLHVLSKNVDYLPNLIENLGWADRFASVSYSQEVGVSKPDPRLFRLMLGRAGRRPAEAVYIGDSWESDYLGAREAGLRAIWVNRSRRRPPAVCPQVPDLRGIPRLLPAPRGSSRSPAGTR
jgi:putative hydrolase of the HAD superfamily